VVYNYSSKESDVRCVDGAIKSVIPIGDVEFLSLPPLYYYQRGIKLPIRAV
jgi:hypothetical protein